MSTMTQRRATALQQRPAASQTLLRNPAKAMPTRDVTVMGWHDDLLKSRDTQIVQTLTNHITNKNTYLDLSHSALDQLSVDTTGLKELSLPPTASTLKLHGHRPSSMKVISNGYGHWLWVWARGKVPPVRGLKRLRGLRIDAADRVDLTEVVRRFPGLRHLQLFGAPGTITNLSALTALPELEALLLVDVLGYTADEFPLPQQWPALTSLVLGRVPADVGHVVRTAYRPASRNPLEG